MPQKPDWQPPENWPCIRTIDAHAAGEPLRVVVDGYPDLPGTTILARRRYAREHLDHLRTALMWEPRGHADMYGCVLTSAVSPEADFGVLFMHNEGYSTMCGHGVIALTTVVLQTGMLPIAGPETVVKMDTPAGLVTARARIENGTVKSISFQNVPAFVVALDARVHVPGLGNVRYDLAFGGAFYAYVDAEALQLQLVPENVRQLIDVGMRIKRAVAARGGSRHPFAEDLSFLYGTIFIGPAGEEGVHSRNVCIFAGGEVDRSPTGTGVSGRLAIHFARGEIRIGDELVIESIIGSRFTGRVVTQTRFGGYDAVIPEIEGSAHIVGRSEFFIDPDDPLGHGFLLR